MNFIKTAIFIYIYPDTYEAFFRMFLKVCRLRPYTYFVWTFAAANIVCNRKEQYCESFKIKFELIRFETNAVKLCESTKTHLQYPLSNRRLSEFKVGFYLIFGSIFEKNKRAFFKLLSIGTNSGENQWTLPLQFFEKK